MGLFQASAYALMLSSAPAKRLSTASAALSLSQASGTVLSVAVVGGIFSWTLGAHLAELQTGDLGPVLEAQELYRQGFILAYQEVFRLGALVVLGAACVFAIGSKRGAGE